MTEAHDQSLTLHLITHVPAHEPREDDPHYHLFEQVKARMKRQGLWKCVINDDYCQGNVELHHSHIEYSQAGGVDLDKINEQLGLHLENDEDFQRWIESPGNLEPLCAVHHRTHFGVHVIPGPLWEPLRYRKANVKPSAEFVPASQLAGDAGTPAKAAKATTGRRKPTRTGGAADAAGDQPVAPRTEERPAETAHTDADHTTEHHTTEHHTEEKHGPEHTTPRPRRKEPEKGFFSRLFGRD